MPQISTADFKNGMSLKIKDSIYTLVEGVMSGMARMERMHHMKHISTGVNSDTQDNRLGAKAISRNKKKARKRFSITQFLRAGVMVSSIFVLLVSSFFFPATFAHAEDTGSVTYEHNLLTIKGPKISRDTILAAIANIPDTDYFGVLIDGDVEIINCVVGDSTITDGSFLQKRDHITSYQCLGNLYLSGEPAPERNAYINARCLFQNLGSQEHPVTQLDARGLHALNITYWNNLFSNASTSFHSLNWVGAVGAYPDDWDSAYSRELTSAFSFPNINQVIMSPSSLSQTPLKYWDNLDADYTDRFQNAKLFINGAEDPSYALGSKGMFGMLAEMIVTDQVSDSDNTSYNFVIPNADVSVGFYAAGGAWEGNDGTYEYVQQQTQKSLQGIKPTLPEAPTREGYTFVGWTSDPRSGTPDITQETIPEFGVCNCAYYAVWQKDEPTPPTPPSPEPTPEPIPASDGELIPSTGDRAMGSLALFATGIVSAALFGISSILKHRRR